MYSDAINSRGGLLSTEPMIMTLLLIQHKMIKNLIFESTNTNENLNYLKNYGDKK